MKIKVSKTFAKFINSVAQEQGWKVLAQVVTVSKEKYSFIVGGDIYDAAEYGDYDYTTGKVKAIMLTYPAEYYSCGQYLTTKLLNKEFKRQNVSDVSGLKRMIRDLCEI